MVVSLMDRMLLVEKVMGWRVHAVRTAANHDGTYADGVGVLIRVVLHISFFGNTEKTLTRNQISDKLTGGDSHHKSLLCTVMSKRCVRV